MKAPYAHDIGHGESMKLVVRARQDSALPSVFDKSRNSTMNDGETRTSMSESPATGPAPQTLLHNSGRRDQRCAGLKLALQRGLRFFWSGSSLFLSTSFKTYNIQYSIVTVMVNNAGATAQVTSPRNSALSSEAGLKPTPQVTVIGFAVVSKHSISTTGVECVGYLFFATILNFVIYAESCAHRLCETS